MDNTAEKNGRTVVIVMPPPHLNDLFTIETQLAALSEKIERQGATLQQLKEAQAANNANGNISFVVSELTESLRLKDRKTLSVFEAAHHAGVKAATVRKWLNNGKLKGAKTGSNQQSHWRISIRDLDRFLERVNNTPQ